MHAQTLQTDRCTDHAQGTNALNDHRHVILQGTVHSTHAEYLRIFTSQLASRRAFVLLLAVPLCDFMRGGLSSMVYV